MEMGDFENSNLDKPAPEGPSLAVTSRDHKRSTVRFTDDEFDRIKAEATLSGESVPTLLKKSHFRREKLRILLSEVERRVVCSELRRIGNNVNQIAKRVNSGVLEGWHSEFQEATQKLSALYQLVVGAYGNR